MIMLPKATRVMSDRQPIALIGHDVVGTGGRMGNLPVYHLKKTKKIQFLEIPLRGPEN